MTRILLSLYLVLRLGVAAAAEDLTAQQIVDKANQAAYYAGTDGRADVRMVIRDAGGGQRIREFTILRMNTELGNQKFYLYFQAPADVRKMAYLVWKNVGDGQDDDRWLWLPALNLARRIAPGDKRTPFVGSDFLYEDVSGRNTRADTHRLVETTDTQYIIESTPQDATAVEFAAYRVWIDRDTFLPRKAEYVDRHGQPYRRVAATRVETIHGYPTVIESQVEDLVSGGSTVNTFSDVKYEIGLKETIFSERFLRRPPREVMR